MILRKANFPKQEYNRTFTQITTNDSRFYEDGEKTYPSVTYVLSYYPKGRHFEEWLKKVGMNADYIAKKSADEGTIVHNLAEAYLLGKEIKLMPVGQFPSNDFGLYDIRAKYTFTPTIRIIQRVFIPGNNKWSYTTGVVIKL